jgi:hypothetical protein
MNTKIGEVSFIDRILKTWEDKRVEIKYRNPQTIAIDDFHSQREILGEDEAREYQKPLIRKTNKEEVVEV